MNKSTKGALAAGAAAVLLMGGAGTLAFWSDSEIVPGGAINAGHLRLTPASTPACGAWELDSGEDAPVVYTVGDPLVPGDVLTRTCNYTLEATGNHMRGTLELDTPTLTDGTPGFGTDIVAAVDEFTVGGVVLPEFTEDNDGDPIVATISVTFNPASTNVTQDATAVLNDLTLTATQIHS